jgi:hydroxyacylglutathione hydrolase
MIITKTMDKSWLSNTWLVADKPGGHAVLIDTGGPTEPIFAKVKELGLTVTHALCTHHHIDHVANNGVYRDALGCKVCGHEREKDLFGDLDTTLTDGEEISSGDLTIRAIHVPGHTLGQLSFLVNESRVFTGDTLFKGSIGGTRGPGHTTYTDIKHSIMDVLLKLPPETLVHPGHVEATTIAQEFEQNPFVRVWRGKDAEGTGRCTAMGEEATLVLRSPDYDGGTKCWVRFAETGEDDIVPGSMVFGD